MNTPTFHDLIEDAAIALAVLEKSKSPAFRQDAARQLVDIAKQLQAEVSKPETRQTEAAATEPQTTLPDPPDGMKWEYRGIAWNPRITIPDYLTMWVGHRGSATYRRNAKPDGIADHHYWEAVPITPEPANPDRTVIDLAMKYRTRDGGVVTNLKRDEDDGVFSISGKHDGITRYWTECGKWESESTTHPLDLIPTGEPV